jgi:hypothetical protein
MTVQEECARLRELIDLQEPLLTAVAEGTRSQEDADADYDRVHVDLRRSLEALKVRCYCPWTNVFGWYGYSLTLGDPEWREWLAGQGEIYKVALENHEKGPAPFRFVPYNQYGHTDVAPPFERWKSKLQEHKRVALELAIERDLAYDGPGVADDQTDGRWIHRNGQKVLEFKIHQGGKSIETADGRGCPFDEISLRVWCRIQDDEIVILCGHDKGADVHGEQDAIDRAFQRLKELEGREAKAAKNGRLGREA